MRGRCLNIRSLTYVVEPSRKHLKSEADAREKMTKSYWNATRPRRFSSFKYGTEVQGSPALVSICLYQFILGAPCPVYVPEDLTLSNK
jgi:hypothetical protein